MGIDYTDNNDKIYIDNISLSAATGNYEVLTLDGLVMEQSDFEEVYTVLSYQENHAVVGQTPQSERKRSIRLVSL